MQIDADNGNYSKKFSMKMARAIQIFTVVFGICLLAQSNSFAQATLGLAPENLKTAVSLLNGNKAPETRFLAAELIQNFCSSLLSKIPTPSAKMFDEYENVSANEIDEKYFSIDYSHVSIHSRMSFCYKSAQTISTNFRYSTLNHEEIENWLRLVIVASNPSIQDHIKILFQSNYFSISTEDMAGIELLHLALSNSIARMVLNLMEEK